MKSFRRSTFRMAALAASLLAGLCGHAEAGEDAGRERCGAEEGWAN